MMANLVVERALMRTKLFILLTWELTTVHFMDLYVGAPEKIHRHVWLERLHWLPT